MIVFGVCLLIIAAIVPKLATPIGVRSNNGGHGGM